MRSRSVIVEPAVVRQQESCSRTSSLTTPCVAMCNDGVVLAFKRGGESGRGIARVEQHFAADLRPNAHQKALQPMKAASCARCCRRAVDLRHQTSGAPDFSLAPQQNPKKMTRSPHLAHRPSPSHVYRWAAKIGGDRFGDVVAGQDRPPLHDIAQLRRIASPAVGLRHRHGVIAPDARGKAAPTAE